jgi:GH18 family chitinase
MVCYYGTWAVYRPGKGKFDVESIDPTVCTHFIYGFAKLSDNRIKSYDPWQDLYESWGKGNVQIRDKIPKFRTLCIYFIMMHRWIQAFHSLEGKESKCQVPYCYRRMGN